MEVKQNHQYVREALRRWGPFGLGRTLTTDLDPSSCSEQLGVNHSYIKAVMKTLAKGVYEIEER